MVSHPSYTACPLVTLHICLFISECQWILRISKYASRYEQRKETERHSNLHISKKALPEMLPAVVPLSRALGVESLGRMIVCCSFCRLSSPFHLLSLSHLVWMDTVYPFTQEKGCAVLQKGGGVLKIPQNTYATAYLSGHIYCCILCHRDACKEGRLHLQVFWSSWTRGHTHARTVGAGIPPGGEN